jgi:hypothetical protein
MPIMAKSNDEYAEVKAIKTPDGTEIDYVLSKVDNTYKRTYTATRELEDTPPLEFKSIKPNSNLVDYRIYGQTSRNLAPTISSENGWAMGYIDANIGPTTIHNFGEILSPLLSLTNITSFTISASQCNNPSLSVYYYQNGTYVGARSSTNYSGATFDKASPFTGVTDFRFAIRTGAGNDKIQDVIDSGFWVMLNSGSTPLPYEPYGESVGDRTGNLFDENWLDNSIWSEGTWYFDNHILKYTATGDSRAWGYNSAQFKFTLKAGTYTISTLTVKAPEHNQVYAGWIVSNSGGQFLATAQGNDFISKNIIIRTFTLNEETNIGFCFKTMDGEYQIMLNEGTTPFPYEPYGYKVPVTVSNGTDTLTTPIYLPEQIKKVGDEAEYIDYGEQKQHIETTDGQEKYVVGLNVDFENKTFTRLAEATGLNKGTDFDRFSAFGGRRRCNVADNGTITAYYGDANYTEDGSNGQVMVYQPAFYYKVEPLKIEAQESGIGYHLRNVNYYISNYQGEGYKLHPAFYNEAGDRVDYILLGAYEGCIYDTSANAYITDDSQVLNTSEDKFSSIANVKPASGLSQSLTRPNLETICKNRGGGWHSLDIRIASMEQLLMIIELGTMNTQTGAGSNGIVSITDNSAYNCSSITGSTANLGNTSGQAAATISDIGGTQTVETANGKTAYSFRGDENPWGNIWKFVYGVNIWGDGTMHGGVPYICKDYNFAESKRTDNYESAGFSVPNDSGYINALGYSKNFDWLMMPSEIGGNSSLPVGDYAYVASNLNGYRIALLGGTWIIGVSAGGFHWYLPYGVGTRNRLIGGRLVYVPQIKKQHIYTTDLDVTLPALPTLTGTNVLSVGTEVQPSDMYIKGNFKMIAGGGE